MSVFDRISFMYVPIVTQVAITYKCYTYDMCAIQICPFNNETCACNKHNNINFFRLVYVLVLLASIRKPKDLYEKRWWNIDIDIHLAYLNRSTICIHVIGKWGYPIKGCLLLPQELLLVHFYTFDHKSTNHKAWIKFSQ